MSDSGSGSDGVFPVYIAVCLGLVFGWVCCCCITSKGCTDCSYSDGSLSIIRGDGEVWERSITSSDRDRRLALQLQAQEQELMGRQQYAHLSPEQQAAAEQERERRLQHRANFVRRHLPAFPFQQSSCHSKSPLNDDAGRTRPTVLSSPSLEESSQQCCCICLGKFRPDDAMAKSTLSKGNCHHEFHYDCIVAWLVRKSKCPICRETFLEEDWEREQLLQSGSAALAAETGPVAATNSITQNQQPSSEHGVAPENMGTSPSYEAAAAVANIEDREIDTEAQRQQA
ncbi:hypothetical protein ACA910_001050 [Epithemia clementina (nom. ined.)]